MRCFPGAPKELSSFDWRISMATLLMDGGRMSVPSGPRPQ
jgi:environmental stress-induced protein Ves